MLRPAPEAIDLAVLKLLADDPGDRRSSAAAPARRLWAACGLPDFRKVGPMHHARMVRRLFSYIGEGGPHPARMVRRRGRAARQYQRRHRGARRPHRRDPQLGLYRPPRRLAAGARRNGRAHARGRRAAFRRAARAADPALRRPPHRGAGARHRRARRRRACRSPSPPMARSASAPSRSAISPASSSGSILGARSPTSACCWPPPSGGSAKSSIAARPRWSRRPTTHSRCGRGRLARLARRLGAATCSRGSRRAVRCSSRRCAPLARSTGCRRKAAPRCANGSSNGSTRRSHRHLLLAASRWPPLQPTQRASPGRARACGDAGRRRRLAPAQGHAERHRASRAGRPPGAAPAAASALARSTSSCRRC